MDLFLYFKKMKLLQILKDLIEMSLLLMYLEKIKSRQRVKKNVMKSRKKLRKLSLDCNYLEKELNKVPGIQWKSSKRQSNPS